MLAALVNGLEEGVIDADTKSRIIEAQAQSRMAAERTSLRDEIIKELRPASNPQANQKSNADRFEAQLMAEIKQYGLDDTDEDLFDWTKAATLYQNGDFEGVQRYVRGQIAEGLAATNADGRRQARVESSTKTPDPEGESRSIEDRMFIDGDVTDVKAAREWFAKNGINT